MQPRRGVTRPYKLIKKNCFHPPLLSFFWLCDHGNTWKVVWFVVTGWYEERGGDGSSSVPAGRRTGRQVDLCHLPSHMLWTFRDRLKATHLGCCPCPGVGRRVCLPAGGALTGGRRRNCWIIRCWNRPSGLPKKAANAKTNMVMTEAVWENIRRTLETRRDKCLQSVQT